MNILFFLTPKSEVAYIHDTYTIRQTLEMMRRHGYTAMPMINEAGKYVGTVTQGDLLWRFLEDQDMSVQELVRIPVRDIPRETVNRPVSISSDIQDLISTATNQNFVPVIDDEKVFIGIVTRKDILQYCQQKLFS